MKIVNIESFPIRVSNQSDKGRKIDTINDHSTRPMLGVAREGIFNSLQFSIEKSEVLDLR